MNVRMLYDSENRNGSLFLSQFPDSANEEEFKFCIRGEGSFLGFRVPFHVVFWVKKDMYGNEGYEAPYSNDMLKSCQLYDLSHVNIFQIVISHYSALMASRL